MLSRLKTDGSLLSLLQSKYLESGFLEKQDFKKDYFESPDLAGNINNHMSCFHANEGRGDIFLLSRQTAFKIIEI